MTKTSTNTDSQLFLESLLNNAFDFLEVAINQFETQPKYSVINFCSAVELILKARLLKEHWSLVVLKEPNLTSFQNGDFQSVIFSRLVPKIRAVLNEDISTQAEDCFNKLAMHRNKLVHFYHSINTPEATKDDIIEIVLEQHSAWKYLQELFTQWKDIYTPYQLKIDNLNALMKGYERQRYLKEKFDKVKNKIEEMKKQGSTFLDCDGCNFPSNHEKQLTENLYSYNCWVCGQSENALLVPCPNEDCSEIIRLNEQNIYLDSFECPSCGETFNKDYIIRLIDTNPQTQDNFGENLDINCVNCSSMGSGVEHDDFFVCLDCLSITKDAPACEWCLERIIGVSLDDLEDSYECGCAFCDGHSGWHNNYEDE